MTTDNHITDKQLRQWRAALERARHDLTFLSGAVVTDRIDLIDQELAWRIDHRRVIAELDAALSEFVATVAWHWSDCAVHNGPAYPPGPCDCGWARAEPVRWRRLSHRARIRLAAWGMRFGEWLARACRGQG